MGCSTGQLDPPTISVDDWFEVCGKIRPDREGSVLEVHLRVDGGPSELRGAALDHRAFAADYLAEEGWYLRGELGADGGHHHLLNAGQFVHLLLNVGRQGEEALAVGVDLREHIEDEVLSDAPLAGVRCWFEANSAAPSDHRPSGEGIDIQGESVGPFGEVTEILTCAVVTKGPKSVEELHRCGTEAGLPHVTLIGELFLVHPADLRDHVFEFHPACGGWGAKAPVEMIHRRIQANAAVEK